MRLINIVGLCVVLAACANDAKLLSDEATAGTELDKLEHTLSMAEAKYQQSKIVGFAWRATGISIGAAKAALAADDLETARQQIQQAMQLAQASLIQAETEAVNWQQRPPFAE